METIRKIEKANTGDYRIGATEENGLDYEIIEKVIENNYVSQITVEEVTDKINQISNSKDAIVMVEVLGLVRTPAIIFKNFEAFIETKEMEDEGIFKLISHTDDVGNLEFDAFEVRSVEWDKWNGYFLIKFIENIEIMISYELLGR